MKRIVAIDDSEEIRELIEVIFRDEYEIKTMESFKANYKKIIDFNPDVIVIDYNLGYENGADVIIKAKKDFQKVKFFILTGSVEKTDMLDALKEENIIIDYFLKTSSPFDLLNSINESLEE
jgi:DNA-binding response OmpR family regulator